MKKFSCNACGWEYDPAEGFPEMNIAPGTPFESLTDEFECPLCAAPKQYFSEEE